MLSVMRVLDEFEPKETTNLLSSPKCFKRVLDEFPHVMLEKLLNELPPKRWVDHAIKVMLGVAPLAKAPYRMSYEELKELKVQLGELLAKGYIKPNTSPYGAPVFLFTRRMGHWGCVWIIEPSTRGQWKINTNYFELMICLIDSRELKCLVGLTYVSGITKFELQNGMKKRLFVTQGMVHTSFWWCLLDSPMHLPHFAPSWMTSSGSGLMTSWSYT